MRDGALTVLVLAGSRGPGDPVARHAGARHKAFVPVAGVPMLLRVVRTLVACPAVGRIALCLDGDAPFETVPELAALAAAGRVVRVPSVGTPALSVRRALDSLATPLLLATADHPLLTAAMVEHFCAAAP
ncbi:MAG TPA: NTP transferase domain-containing protein, partial [Dongiaceae bacterium]|nr:NTP transferase domain-containing protein [Dongiaceae bacterium]